MIIYSQKYYNKYSQIVKHYKELDLKKSDDLYTESHHILPKSMGGTNHRDNLVRVPARVHFLLHWMLYKIYRTQSMAFAWHSMTTFTQAGKRYNSRSFAYARELFLINSPRIGKVHSDESRKKMSASYYKRSEFPMKGKLHSSATKLMISNNLLGKKKPKRSKEHCENLSKSLTGIKLSESHVENMLNAQNNKPHIICPHCSKSGHFRIMGRWHFDKCKYKTIEEISL